MRNVFIQQEISDGNYMIAQLFPSYDQVTMTNNCILTCREQSNGHGGILALRAKTMNIDGTSKILTTGKGMLGEMILRYHEIITCVRPPIHKLVHSCIHSFIL